VRRAFLCGEDAFSGKSFEHRRGWIRDKLFQLAEIFARQANQEDGCTGRFWEGRYKSNALLDDEALIACLSYVDLNPIRAGMAQSPEASEYTSIKDRIECIKRFSGQPQSQTEQPAHLLPFIGNHREEIPKGLPFEVTEYLQLVDWTGRAMLEKKRGFISSNLPPILERLEIEPGHWFKMSEQFERQFKGLVGRVNSLKNACQTLGYRRTPNLAVCQQLLM
jgi:hypothetical protein